MTSPEAGPREFWNAMYDRDDYRYGTDPNAWLVECAPRLKPCGRVLVPGDGEGRNGVWLAEQGFDVVTIDASDRGPEKARRLAEARGVSPDIRRGLFPADLDGAGLFDAVVLCYIHAPGEARARLHRACLDHLAPGGALVLEGFTPDQIGRTSGGPQTVDRLLTPALLREDFGALDVEVLREEEVRLTEGEGHSGLGAVVRLLAFRR